MKILNKLLLSLLVAGICSQAAAISSYRIPQISNQRIEAWETVIYPGKTGVLKKHRHNGDRVLVALTDGVLKVVNNRGQRYLLKLYKNHAYFLEADSKNETHTDENVSGNIIKVLVIDLK